ncbi:MAG: HindVP family restriction endonuclease [Dysgonamonadaceae bacterium]|nr:HindVP family restriction endonuclease [Dysgonamonadaceae bacterium]
MEEKKPSLFGIRHSNRNFEDQDEWGKNKFNSSFPAALSAYLGHKKLNNVYLTLDENKNIKRGKISTECNIVFFARFI